MKFTQFISLFLFTATCCMSYANDLQEQQKLASQENKIYVEPSCIFMDHSGIRVFSNQNWVTTNAVFSDANGFYIVDGKGGWTCGRCGTYNTENLYVCRKCEGPR